MESDERLESWKEIAAYLKRDVTTVQRWEKREGMPVRRHLHDKLGSVYAFRSELDAWTRSRHPAAVPEDGGIATTAGAAPRPRDRHLLKLVLVAMGASLLLALLAIGWRLARADYFWRNPLANARFQDLSDFGGIRPPAVVSRDGRFVAFLSDHDGGIDVWVTQVGTGIFYNLTRGRIKELVNPSIRTLGFSPDGALVTFWTRHGEDSGRGDIGVWAVPTLGGQPRPYLETAAEFDWSADGSRLVYHTAGAGDPMFVRDPGQRTRDRQIFVASTGLHGHFPLWAPDGAFVYFVAGSVPDAMDIWRVRPTGGPAERLTVHNSRVSDPVFLNDETLAYLATNADGSGPSLYSLDIDRRVPRRLDAGLDRYTSLSASADGRRLVATRTNPNGTLWRVAIGDTPGVTSSPAPISLTTGRGFAPCMGPGYLVYVSSKGTGDGIWKLAEGMPAELWSAPETRIIGGPDVTSDGKRLVFSAQHRDRRSLYVMNADGTSTRSVTDALRLLGAPAWAPDGQSIVSAVEVEGVPRVFRIALDGSAVRLVQDYSVDPVWAPDGTFLVYSGPDVGTSFPVKAATAAGAPYEIAKLSLTRGGRRLRFLRERNALVVLRGDIQHKDLWLVDLNTGAERQLTRLPSDFNVRDFDVSADGKEVVLERVQERSDIVLIDLAPRE